MKNIINNNCGNNNNNQINNTMEVKTMKQLNVNTINKVINSDDSYTRTYNDFRDYFSKPENRKGYFIGYRDSLACAIMNAATDSGLSIPEDIEVLSLVGTKYSYIVRPTLSTLHVDMHEVGQRAMYMLTALMNCDLIDRSAHFDAAFVQGQSTKVRG